MAETLVHTKLHVPALRPNLVLRPQLIERLNLGLYHKLTLVSAPAGFGKTTLIIEWIAGCERPCAWLSLDEGDNDPTRFLAYLIAAIQMVVPTVGTGTLAALQSPHPPTMDAVLPVLVNEIATVRDKFVLVLDDYHLIDAKVANDILTFLLEHLPSQMHLVIATREDPPLPLARLRARDQLTELRVADLRFSQTEAASFLNQVMGIDLTARDISILASRTEGWIAGLQLAALSIRGRENVSEFIDTFAGENRYIVDYLIEEVLQRQPERVRRFLQQTSILDRLCGPLCDAVTGQEEGKALLEVLERENLFVVPIDDRRHWYRYHQLFADVLHARLVDTQPDQIAALQRRASEWFERNGQFSDAVRHALAAEDFDRAADLLETMWRAMNRSYQSATLLGWMKALPNEVVRTRPLLCIGYAWASLSCGELEASENRLQDAEKWLRSTEAANEQPATTLPVDDERYHSLAASIANARAYHAQALGDRSGTLKYAQRALDLLPEDDHFERGVTGTLLGLTHWANGDLEKAARTFADGLADIRKAGNNLAAISGTFVLAGIRVAQGRLRDAVTVYEQALQLATEPGAPILRGTADLYVGLSELLREQGDLEAATRGVLKSKELGEQATLPPMQYRSPAVVMARIKQSQGALDGALDLLHEAQRLYIRGPVPDVRPVTALKARVWIAQGRLRSAQDWARERGLSVQDDLNYLREFEHVTLARLLITEYEKGKEDRAIREALTLLKRLLNAAEEGKRMGSVIEILMLQALANEARENRSLARACLERALALAEPQGYVRIFVDEGVPMAALLSDLAARGVMPDFVGQLLTAQKADRQTVDDQSERPSSPPVEALVEPLSPRELEVLQLVAQGLTNRQIGEKLFLALDTVKGHNRRIYGKLQVQRRTEAVARARELGLL